jgi:hypothetical protein
MISPGINSSVGRDKSIDAESPTTETAVTGQKRTGRKINSFVADILSKDDEYTVGRGSKGLKSRTESSSGGPGPKKTSFNRLQVRVKTLTLRRMESKLLEL